MVMIVDSMEKNDNIIDTLIDNGVPIERKVLQVGDYQFNNFVIERKEINDFVSSVANHHLFDQLKDIVYNLSLNSEAKSALIIHGDLSDIEYRYLKYFDTNTFYKFIGDVFTHYPKVSYFWVQDEEAFATLISAMYHQSFSRKIEHQPFVKKTKNHKVNVLVATKLFSVAQAKRILRTYSLRQIFNMELSEMVKIKGFGKIGVDKFIKFRGKK